MVANSPVERTGPGQMDYLLNRLNDIERRLDQQGAKSTYPFSIGHAGVRDFSVEPSASGDGTADIFMGNGAGNNVIQIRTDSTYGTKIFILRDQLGTTVMSTDALSGFGLGSPSYAYPFGGREENNMAASTSHAGALQIGVGIAYAYNPCAYFQPVIRVRSASAQTLKVYAQFRHWDLSTYDTAEIVYPISAGSISIKLPEFAAQWLPLDMNRITAVFFKAFCDTGTPSDVFAQLTYQVGYGTSQVAYNSNSTAAK